MKFLTRLFKRKNKRKLYDGQAVADDYEWSIYHEEYSKQLYKLETQHTLKLADDAFELTNGKIQLASGLPELHPNHRCVYETIAALNPDSVIEVGCGGGDHLHNLLKLFPNCKVKGFDRSQGQLSFLKERSPHLANLVECLDLTTVPDPLPTAVDTVYSQAVIMHIHNGEGHLNALTNMCRMARKHVVLMENWTRHSFLDDLRQLHAQGRIPKWDAMNIYFRRFEGKPYLMIASPLDLDLEPLDDYSLLLNA